MKILRTAWPVTITMVALLFLFITNAVPLSIKTTAMSILGIVLFAQLVYHYFQWKNQTELHGE